MVLLLLPRTPSISEGKHAATPQNRSSHRWAVRACQLKKKSPTTLERSPTIEIFSIMLQMEKLRYLSLEISLVICNFAQVRLQLAMVFMRMRVRTRIGAFVFSLAAREVET